jgi:hypothetical protein
MIWWRVPARVRAEPVLFGPTSQRGAAGTLAMVTVCREPKSASGADHRGIPLVPKREA